MLNATRSVFTGMFRRFGLGTIAGVVLVLGMGVAAFAYWTAVGSGAGSASASGLNPPTNVSLVVNDSAVTVSFTGVTPTNGTLSGYYVQRNNGSVTSNACGTNPATPSSLLSLSATSCVDSSVPNGTYTYTVTSVLNTWTATSAASNSLVVTGDTHAPSQVVSMTSSNALKTGNTIYFRAAAAGSLTLSAAVTDGISGPASATFPAISTTGWTHASETVTTGSGTNPKTFTSSTFSWNADAATPSTYGVVGQDVVGNQTTTDLTFVADNAGPTGGALTVNGTTGTSAGAVNVITTGADFTGSKTNFSADVGSGYLSTTLTREASTSSSCTAWATASTISSISEDGSGAGMTVSNDRCYRYTLTGTDKVGNTSVLSVIVAFVDGQNATQVFSLSNPTNAVLSGTSLYYRSNLAGEFVLNSAVTDNASGPKQVVFPAIATTGWTHNAETVTSGSGSYPTITYTSSKYSWTSGASNPSGSVRNIVASDWAGNTTSTVLNTIVDNAGPAVSGALTVNGAGGSAGGTTSYTNATFLGTKTDFTDAGVGISTNVLTREFATITSGVCDTFGSATVIASISETTPAVGCYRYTLTATDLLANVSVLKTTVMVDLTAPSSVAISETSADGYLSGSTLYFRSGVSGSLTLSAAVTDAFPGAASATFPAISTTNWTHNAETITSGSGSNPITYTSSSFSWTSTAVAPTGTRTISGADKAGNSANATPISFVADAAGPTGGALTVAGTPGTSGGATVATNSALFSGSYTNFSADAGSGFASSVLVRETATLTSGACGSFGNSSTITSISETALATGCYRYTLTGTDNVGNTSVLSATVQVDVTAPSVVVTESGANSSQTGSTVYYRGDLASSLTLSAAVTDAASGAASATFPAVATTGWTHNAETITSAASTSGTTKTYNSSNLSWTASPSNPGSYTVTGTDAAGNAGTSAVTFTADTTGPTGGTLTVNGLGVTSGSTVAGANASYNVTKTDFSADAGSGYASTANITREYATLSGATCGTFGNSSTASSFTEVSGGGSATLSSGRCYRYTMTGTDNVGNTTTIQRTIYFETTNPTQALTLATSSNAVLSGTTLYYRSNLAGSFTLADAVTDSGSGADSANFPVIGTTGWTHNVETVTSGTGTNPKTFTSTAYSWTSGASNPTSKTITGYDFSGNSATTSLSFSVDNAGPASSGALTVNGAGGSAGGTTSYTNTTFLGTKTNFTDAGVGISTNVLTREFATITDGVCDSFDSATVIASISETTPAVGCYRYTLTATDLLDNVSVLKTTVMVDLTAPSSVAISETSADGYLSGSTLYFRSGVSGSLTLSAAVTDAFPGAASATFPAISTTNWTHNAETITSGSGSNPITYISSSFSWTSTAVAPTGTRTISGADKVGNATNATPISFVADAAGPTGGALTVAGTSGTSGGATVATSSALFSGSYTNFSVDAGSGVASSVLVRETATLTSGACGSFGNSSTITSISESALATGCYRYTLTGTDNVGNTSVLRTIVQVDVTAPTVVVTENGANSVQSGPIIYYRGDLATSTVLSAAVTDAASGAASASFPAVATTGWTHNAETISSAASTSGTTKTYNSSNLSWTASPSNPGSYTVTGTDAAGNAGTSAVTFTADTTGPTGGTLTVNGTTGTAAGAVNVITTAANFTGSKTDFSADAGSGYASTTLTREVSTSSSCESFGSLTTISSISEKGPEDRNPTTADDTCYRYTLTGTDNLGNTSTVSVIVSMTDNADPTPVLTMGSATNAVLSQSSSTAATIYYRKDLSGSFTLVNTLTDYASGPKSSLFPAISTTGWTHNVETVTSGTGARPTIAYNSTSWSWTGSGSLTNPSSKNVTSSDQANNTINTALTFTSDTTAPTGGSITINGTASTNGGTTAFAPNTFTATVANFTDAGAGIGTNVITRATATLTGSTCGTFGTAAVVASISESGATGCIKYVLTGTDLLANATTSTITVKVDGSAPTVAVSGETGANSYSDGSNIYYRSGSSGSFTLTATVDDAFPGAKSATFPAIATTGWTHGAETVTTAASTSGTVTTYNSSSFTWTASPSVPASYTVTGADQAGNTATSTVAFVADAAGPTAGALAVNSVNGTSVGSTSYSKTGTFSGTFTQFSADAGSGFASSAITKESATLTNGTCGSYSAGTAPTGGSISETTVAEGCYRYTVTGTDNVGNTSVLATVVMVDKTAPTQTISASGSNAFVSGSTMYYKGNVAGSTTLSSVLADGKSCGLNMTFPSLSGTSTGFTFTTNTDSSSSGSCPSETFSSANALTWTNPTSSSPTMAIVGSDNAGNTVTTTLTLTNDITVPTSGALSADGTAATSGGTVKNSTMDPFTLSATDFSDAGSGLASSTLTYATATYDKPTLVCGSYGSESTISKTGSPLAYPTTFGNSVKKNCIRFTLTGTDKVGNTSTLIVTHTRD